MSIANGESISVPTTVQNKHKRSGKVKMQDNDSLDEMRRRIQESLIQAKREQLRDEFGMQLDYMGDHLSPEAKNHWLDYLLDFVSNSYLLRKVLGNWQWVCFISVESHTAKGNCAYPRFVLGG